MTTLSFKAYGVAAPKGSARAFMPKGWKRPVITSDNKSVRGWTDSVRAAAQVACGGTYFLGAVDVSLAFALPRPKSHGKKRPPHTKKPDVDKLGRWILDALTGVIWNDDAQVVRLELVKRYADDQPYCAITVTGEAVPVSASDSQTESEEAPKPTESPVGF